jgi:nucleotide-binding universal stress UspA family protein
MYRNILVPVDDSAASMEGVEQAVDLAKALGSRIKLVHVINRTPWMALGVEPASMEELVCQIHDASESMLRRVEKEVRASGVDVDAKLIEAFGERVGEFVVAQASSWPADLIICGTHGRRGVHRILMGGDAEYILRHSPVPVLFIPAHNL